MASKLLTSPLCAHPVSVRRSCDTSPSILPASDGRSFGWYGCRFIPGSRHFDSTGLRHHSHFDLVPGRRLAAKIAYPALSRSTTRAIGDGRHCEQHWLRDLESIGPGG